MIGITYACSRVFFDTPRVIAALDPVKWRYLGSVGALVRTIARHSMRVVTPISVQRQQIAAGTRKRLRMTAPGKIDAGGIGGPPDAILPHPWLRGEEGSRFGIFFAFDFGRKTVVVGPNLMPGRPYNVPMLHEFGGRVTVRNRMRKVRKLGQVGEIRAPMGDSPTGEEVALRQPNLAGVVFARLRTPAQVARANRLNEQLYGPMTYVGHYRPRPYMRPALEVARPRMGELWNEAVRTSTVAWAKSEVRAMVG